MVTEWTCDLAVPMAEVDDMDDAEVVVRQVAAARPEAAPDEREDAHQQPERTEPVGWFE